MAKLHFTTLLVALVILHATARNIPTDEVTNPSPNALTAEVAVAPATNGAVRDQKNFIAGGMGGWGGVGGFVGVLPLIGGVGVGGAGGVGGMGGASGLGGIGFGKAGGMGGLGGIGLGKVGGIGAGGGVGGAGGIIP